MNIKEKIISVINKVKELKNPNELARMAQNKTAYWVITGLGVFVFAGWFFMHSHGGDISKKPDTKQESAQMDGAVDAQFDQESSKKALDKQQSEIKSLNEKLTEISNQMDFLQKSLTEKSQEEISDNKLAVQELQTKILELEAALLKKSGGQLPAHDGLGTGIKETEPSTRGITTTNFSFFSTGDDSQTTSVTGSIKDTTLGSNTIKAKTAKDYVPPGTFAKAVLLSGADTNAGVHGQTDTTPIVMRILDKGTLPNGNHSSLKGCFVTAAAYGDASSERGQIRLQHLSCVRPGNHILDIPVEGTINDMGGNDGIRGHVVMRNQKLIWNAGVSGFLSGIGSALQQSATTQSISPLGVTNAIKSGKAFEHSAYGGANTALGKLADYYIKLADMYHPIVQVHAGSQVNIVFLKGFSLTEGLSDQAASEKEKKTEITSTQEIGSPDFTQSIKNSHLGQSITEQEINESHNERNEINEEIK